MTISYYWFGCNSNFLLKKKEDDLTRLDDAIDKGKFLTNIHIWFVNWFGNIRWWFGNNCCWLGRDYVLMFYKINQVIFSTCSILFSYGIWTIILHEKRKGESVEYYLVKIIVFFTFVSFCWFGYNWYWFCNYNCCWFGNNCCLFGNNYVFMFSL